MNGETILIVEDEQPIAHVLTTILSANGYHTLQASTGTLARSIINSHCPRLILLDLGLPDMDGLELLRWLREWSGVPVLIVSAREEENQKVEALDLGADDYITKPFGTSELLARIRTALRHSGGEAEPVHALSLGPQRIDPARHQVLAHGREVTLTLKEFQLLSLLVEHAGTVFTRDQLLNTIWGYEFDGASRTVDVHVRTLRQKLGEAGRCIETERGDGYTAESDPSKSEEQP